MADLAAILKDPNYVNANPATKQAIFDKFAPQDPNFANANPETQLAIRSKFGLTPVESGIPAGRAVSQIPTEPGANLAPTVAPPLSTADKIRGVIETPFAVGATALGGLPLYLAGAGGPEFQRKVAEQIQYQPRTQLAQEAVEAVGRAAEASKLPPFLSGGFGVAFAPKVAPVARAVADVVRAENSLIKGAVAPLVEARQQRIQTQRVKESELAAPRIDAAKDAIELGLALDPAISNPSTVARLKTGAVGTTGLQSNLSKINLPVAAKVARQDMGLPATVKLDAKAFETARSTPEISGAYDKVRAVPRVAGD